jgi:hypothetical protein
MYKSSPKRAVPVGNTYLLTTPFSKVRAGENSGVFNLAISIAGFSKSSKAAQAL